MSARKILEQYIVQKIVRPGAAHGEDEEDGKLAGVAASDMATSKEETVNH